MIKSSFPPIVGTRPRVLILGSMPGEASLEKQQYYAHGNNVFWEIMEHLFSIDKEGSYEQRSRGLIKHRIALWDVIKTCQRNGSLDSAIVNSSIEANDFVALFAAHPTIKYVFFNGLKAEKEFIKRVLPALNGYGESLSLMSLPSTSPANAATSKLEKFKRWKSVSRALDK